MKKIVIVKAKSRLGLKSSPFGGDGDLNSGVIKGSEDIVRTGIFSDYECKFLNLDFPLPENVAKATYLEEYAGYLKQGSQMIQNAYDNNTFLVNLGGDHSVAFMSLLTVINKNRFKDIGYIQIDSHGDIHNTASSPSGNFHGMWFRPFVDHFDNKEIDNLVTKKLKPENVMYLGNMDLEKEEEIFINQNKIATFNREKIQTRSSEIAAFINRFAHLHISIDIDAFDQTIAPGTGIKAKNGLFLSDLEVIFDNLSSSQKISVDLVEFNPDKDYEHITLELIEKIFNSIFKVITDNQLPEELEESYLAIGQSFT